ncbi:MAG TPA: gluconate 2-dehydrogenase subunit 3 family protein [Ktedonobacterales bacterium]|nr:gluconate 2-dehydrogenase subunit 3 family protein [Ktedonobacterales bacterium]
MSITEKQSYDSQRQHAPEMEHIDPFRLPIDPQTGKPIPPKAQPGYYPGYSTLSQQDFWDEATRKEVVGRVENIPQITFFSLDEEHLITAIANRILPQDDRDEAHKIPIVPFIDHRLANGIINGYRYENMPPDEEAYHLGLQGIDAIAQEMHGRPFIELEPQAQDHVLITLHEGDPPAGGDIWQRVSVNHFWSMLVQDVVKVYYAHPYAWDEIGYGGPAYPRGYMRLEGGRPEPWEKDERRYAWAAPPTALTGEAHRLGEHGFDEPRYGQGGTH